MFIRTYCEVWFAFSRSKVWLLLWHHSQQLSGALQRPLDSEHPIPHWRGGVPWTHGADVGGLRNLVEKSWQWDAIWDIIWDLYILMGSKGLFWCVYLKNMNVLKFILLYNSSRLHAIHSTRQEVLHDYRQAIRKVIIEHVLKEEKAMGHSFAGWRADWGCNLQLPWLEASKFEMLMGWTFVACLGNNLTCWGFQIF